MYRIALMLVALGYLTFLPALPGGTLPSAVGGDLGPEMNPDGMHRHGPAMDPDGAQLRLGPEMDPDGTPEKLGPEMNPDG